MFITVVVYASYQPRPTNPPTPHIDTLQKYIRSHTTRRRSISHTFVSHNRRYYFKNLVSLLIFKKILFHSLSIRFIFHFCTYISFVDSFVNARYIGWSYLSIVFSIFNCFKLIVKDISHQSSKLSLFIVQLNTRQFKTYIWKEYFLIKKFLLLFYTINRYNLFPNE